MEQHLESVLRHRYELLASLGEGGFGSVYKARQLTTGQSVAIKVLRLHDRSDPQERERRVGRFQREMQLCAQLQHPNIVRLIDSGAEGDLLYTVFEFAPGQDLAQVLADEGALRPTEAKYLMLQVLDALAAAHEKGVIHRDLKPANLMIIPTGARRNVLVLDFGIGAFTREAQTSELHRITLTNESVGTPSYAAPEQLRGHAPTPRSDLYSWGLVFVECLSGKRVIQGATLAQVVFKQLSPDPVPIPAAIAEHPIGSLLRRATSKDVEARNVTAIELLRELDACDLTTLRLQERSSSELRAVATVTVDLEPRQQLIEGERRQVTAVCWTFSARPVGGARVDAEEIDQILGQQQEACAGVARRFGGHIAGALGDTMLFYFGYPTAREDDARRAARAALAVKAEIEARSVSLAKSRGAAIDVRAGVHTGIVVARELRDASLSGLGYVVGATPKLAMKLAARAAPGTILVSATTRPLLRKEFQTEPVVSAAPHEVEALGASLLHGVEVEVGADDIPLVGRGSEIEILLTRWSRAKAGEGQAVLISGEPGIGKSRLARELDERIGDEPHRWLECRCTPDTSKTPFYPIVDLLDRLLDPGREIQPETKVQKLEALLSLYGFELSEAMPLFGSLLSFTLPKSWTPLDVSPQKKREMTRNAVLSLLLELAEREPLVLVLEDLHWADASTLELLDRFVTELPSAPILAVFTARPELTPSWLSSAVHTLPLARLGAPDIERMAARLTGGRGLPAEVVSRIVARTDGVPLFVEEIVRSMIDSGALVEAGDHYNLGQPLSDASIPATLRDSLVARLDRLGRAKETAQIASVLGREVVFDVLRALSSLDEAALHEDLERLVAAELMYRKRRLKGSSFTFKHALVRDAAYDSMLRRTRQQIHARVAAVLEEKFPATVAERPEVLAHHHAAADQKREAVGYGQRAALSALMASANVEAVQHAQAALAWLDGFADGAERAEAELNINGLLVPALMSRGWMDRELKATIDRSHELLAQTPNSTYSGPSLWILALYYLLGGEERAKAAAIAERQIEVARSLGDTGQEAVALALLGPAKMLEGRYAECREDLERALALHDPAKHAALRFMYGQDSKVSACMGLGAVCWFMGYPDQSKAHLDAALTWAKELKHAVSHGVSLMYQMFIAYERRDREAVRAHAAEHRALAERYGLFEQGTHVDALRAWADGDLKTALGAVAMREGFGTRMDLSFYHGVLAEIEADGGLFDAAIERVDRCLARDVQVGEAYHEPKLLRFKGTFLLRRDPGAHDEAQACFRRAIEVARRQGARALELMAATALAADLVQLGRRQEAREALEPIFSWFTEGHDAIPLVEARGLLEKI
jgi:TOMM system kinase/cyclase fusion protein